MKRILLLLIALAASTSFAGELQRLDNNLGRMCGDVVEVKNPRTDSSPYLINFNFYYVREKGKLIKSPLEFQVVLWQEDAKNLSIDPTYEYLGNNICVTGNLTTYNGISQIYLKSLHQIKVNKEE